jgi:hypothetical protein
MMMTIRAAASIAIGLFQTMPQRPITMPTKMPGIGPISDTKTFFQAGMLKARPVTAAPKPGMKNILRLR